MLLSFTIFACRALQNKTSSLYVSLSQAGKEFLHIIMHASINDNMRRST